MEYLNIDILYMYIHTQEYMNIDSGQTDMNYTYVCVYQCIMPCENDAHTHMCKYIHKHIHIQTYARTQI